MSSVIFLWNIKGFSLTIICLNVIFWWGSVSSVLVNFLISILRFFINAWNISFILGIFPFLSFLYLFLLNFFLIKLKFLSLFIFQLVMLVISFFLSDVLWGISSFLNSSNSFSLQEFLVVYFSLHWFFSKFALNFQAF